MKVKKFLDLKDPKIVLNKKNGQRNVSLPKKKLPKSFNKIKKIRIWW